MKKTTRAQKSRPPTSSRGTQEWAELLSAIPMVRQERPRQEGLTMLLDRTLDLGATRELIKFVGAHVDHVKLSFGTSVLVEPSLLKRKLKLLRDAGILVYPGGSLFEIAHLSGRGFDYFRKIKSLGFNCVEISDGMIEVSLKERRAAIEEALRMKFTVVTETGKKDTRIHVPPEQMAKIAQHDLGCGASYVIIEAREAGTGIGIYDAQGKVKDDEVTRLSEKLKELLGAQSQIIWEAPQKAQQAYLINRFGPNVNLGNIAPLDTLGLEALRRGLRWDTFATLSERKRAADSSGDETSAKQKSARVG